MKKRLHLVRIIGAILFAVFSSAGNVMALECWLVPDNSQCATDTSVNPCHTTLSGAVGNSSCDSIKILPGTYPANVTLTRNITIFGVETARTFFTGGGTTSITVDGVTALMEIRNVTFLNASPAVLAKNASTNVSIKNNIFEVGNTATAIQVLDTSSPVILNNTFYQNGTAILSTPNTLSIINNIFVGNSLAISTNVVPDEIRNNLFFQNTTNGNTGIIFTVGDPNYKGNINNADPLFVNATASDVTKRDFHLKVDASNNNPCKDAGNAAGGTDKIDSSTADIGVYGGSASDTIPYQVSGLKITATASNSVDLSWNANTCYQVQGYNVYYGTVSGTYSTGPFDAGSNTTYTLTGLTGATAPTGDTVLFNQIANQTLLLAWNIADVTGATGYEIRYDIDPASPPLPPADPTYWRDAGFTTVYSLSGLQNGTKYHVVVIPYAKATYFIIVKAYYKQADTAFMSIPSNEVQSSIGTKEYGTPSNEIVDYPEAIIPSPNLPNKGCFIATAAYGHYSAPQVQALRDFRDAYLITNAPGRAFVRWYYKYGPVAAAFINDHPLLKPVVRTALLPVVGGAMFMTRTSALEKVMVLSILIGGIGYLLYRRKLLRSGGRQ